MCYAGYLMYDGLPIVLGIEKERAIPFSGAILTVALVYLVVTRVGTVICLEPRLCTSVHHSHRWLNN